MPHVVTHASALTEKKQWCWWSLYGIHHCLTEFTTPGCRIRIFITDILVIHCRNNVYCSSIIIIIIIITFWKVLLARQALQPSWQHLTGWSSMLDCHHRVNSFLLRWSPTAQATGMLFSSWASWAGDWWRRPGMFEHLRFYSNGFPLWCNVAIRFCCMMVFVDDDRPE